MNNSTQEYVDELKKRLKDPNYIYKEKDLIEEEKRTPGASAPIRMSSQPLIEPPKPLSVKTSTAPASTAVASTPAATTAATSTAASPPSPTSPTSAASAPYKPSSKPAQDEGEAVPEASNTQRSNLKNKMIAVRSLCCCQGIMTNSSSSFFFTLAHTNGKPNWQPAHAPQPSRAGERRLCRRHRRQRPVKCSLNPPSLPTLYSIVKKLYPVFVFFDVDVFFDGNQDPTERKKRISCER